MSKGSNRRIGTVIFDLDDTLLDWSAVRGSFGDLVRPNVDKLYDYLVAEGHPLPSRDDFFQVYRQTIYTAWQEAKQVKRGVNFANCLRLCFEALQLDMSRIDMEAVLQAYAWEPMPGAVLYEDTIPVLTCLRENGYKIGLITNSMMPMWMRDIELRAYNILEYFDSRITSGDTPYMKPNPAIYHYALDLLESEAETAVYVGDRPYDDILGANEAGLTSILIDPPHLDYELNGVEPDYTITRLEELLTVLEALNG